MVAPVDAGVDLSGPSLAGRTEMRSRTAGVPVGRVSVLTRGKSWEWPDVPLASGNCQVPDQMSDSSQLNWGHVTYFQQLPATRSPLGDLPEVRSEGNLGFHSTAVGREAIASGTGAQAFSWQVSAAGNLSLAAGHQANAVHFRRPRSGRTPMLASRYRRQTADGFAVTTTRANQAVLGGAGSSVTVGSLASSTAAQNGQSFFATVDGTGTLGQGVVTNSLATQPLWPLPTPTSRRSRPRPTPIRPASTGCSR
jgi:hypothetical protein